NTVEPSVSREHRRQEKAKGNADRDLGAAATDYSRTWSPVYARRPSSALTGQLLGEGDQPLELLARRAPVDRPGRCLDTLFEVARATARDESGGGVHEDDVAP